MIWSRIGCRTLISCLALAVAVIARANQAVTLPLYLHDAIATDSAAAHAAKRWLTTIPSSLSFKIQTRSVSTGQTLPESGIVLAPLTWWRHRLPAFDVLRLPFFYADISAVHHALDGELGASLAQHAQQAGWKLLAVWDAGMTDFSGNQDYSRLQNLSGMQFALWEKDPVQEIELRALDVWSQVIGQHGVERMAQACLVNSRSTTATQMWREHLQRVHLDLTLTRDRYAGYVLAIPMSLWKTFTPVQRDGLTKALQGVTDWERAQAAQQQARATAALHKAGMQVHPLNAEQRRVFAKRMPPWQRFLDQLDAQTAKALIATARRTAATTRLGSTHEKALANPLPGTHAAE